MYTKLFHYLVNVFKPATKVLKTLYFNNGPIYSTQGESLYEVLGISKQSTPEEIKKAYRKVT